MAQAFYTAALHLAVGLAEVLTGAGLLVEKARYVAVVATHVLTRSHQQAVGQHIVEGSQSHMGRHFQASHGYLLCSWQVMTAEPWAQQLGEVALLCWRVEQ